MGPAPDLSATFVRRALDGDARAARELAQAVLPVVHARVARLLLRFRTAARQRDVRQEVEDLTQQVLLALFSNGGRALRAWTPERGLALEKFVGLLSEREVYSILRSRRRSPWTEDPTEEEILHASPDSRSGPEGLIASRQLAQAAVARALERLSERGREMFQWIFVDDRPVDEICEITGMKPGAIYVWRNRITQLLREVAQELQAEPGGPRPPLEVNG
ncbi:MAG TPA: sigma-70 family RNA polymerase sigma factor [Myxococcaceae bacterium]|jgi:RNA polymerase sigma-70 factor (ECF subfamily)